MLKRMKSSALVQINFISRRSHTARAANSTWRLDVTHEVMRWRFVVSVCFNGYSRIFIWLKRSDNNRSQKTYDCFLNAINELQCPSQARGDKGGGNVLVTKYILILRGTDMRGFIG